MANVINLAHRRSNKMAQGLRQVIATIKAVREFGLAVRRVQNMIKINENTFEAVQNRSKVRTKGYIGETPKRFKKRTFSGKKGTFGRK